MSTRAVIARPAGDGWEGRYHHWDGGPMGLGVDLIKQGELHGPDFLIDKLIDSESVGWSSILDADLTMPAEWRDTPPARCHGPLSYGVRGEKPEPLITCTCPSPESTCDPLFEEWAYVITKRGLWVYESVNLEAHVNRGLVEWGDTASMEAIQLMEEAS